MSTENTGSHTTPANQGAPAAPTNPLAGLPTPSGTPTWPQYIIAGLLSLGVSGGWGLARDDAHEQAMRDLERRVEVIETQIGGVEGLRRELAALSATVTAQNAALQQRLQRIEDALDRER